MAAGLLCYDDALLQERRASALKLVGIDTDSGADTPRARTSIAYSEADGAVGVSRYDEDRRLHRGRADREGNEIRG